MNNINHNRYFILINKKNISFQALDTMHKKIFTKEILIDDYSTNDIYSSIRNFLAKNIGHRKKLKRFY